MNLVIETRLFRWICALFIAACVVVRTVDGLFYNWNAIRFSRALAFVEGYDLYTPPGSGVISGVIYGPVGYFLYAPAAVWGSPVPAIITACLISVLVTLGPVALVLWDRRNAGGARPWVLAVFTVLVLHFYASGATPGVWMVHTDAGALGLTCLALYFTLRHPLREEVFLECRSRRSERRAGRLGEADYRPDSLASVRVFAVAWLPRRRCLGPGANERLRRLVRCGLFRLLWIRQISG